MAHRMRPRQLLRHAVATTALTTLLTAPAWAMDYKQAPMLDALVEAGDLPPVEERLPDEPEVVTPLDGIGDYGGTIRRGLRGSSDHNNLLRFIGPQGLVRWDVDYTMLIPNIAKDFEVSEDGSTFTFHLRRGMKWSDGHPFTADDILFNMENTVLDTEFSPVPPRYSIDGEPVRVTKIDDHTVEFAFAGPYGDFLAELASPLGQHPVLYARHYCSQFHPDFNENIVQLIADEGASDWQNLFMAKCGDIEIPARWGNPLRPTLDPWIVTEPYTGGATRVMLERNPFFWQVDTEGNQLPYVDTVNNSIRQDVESLILDAIGGRIDMQVRHLGGAANRPVLAENREAGGYDFFEGSQPGGTNMAISLNLTHKDEAKRALFNERDFRVALSLAIDRDEIIDIALLGEGEPWHGGPFEDHPNHHERYSTQYTEFDPDRANELLDGLGFTERDGSGIRMANGSAIRFQCDVIPTLQPEWVDMLELIEQQWARVGVAMEVNSMERTFFYERTSESNDHDCAVWTNSESWVPGQIPQQLVAVHHDSRYGIAWYHWYTSGGERGEEPPPVMLEQMDRYDRSRAVVDQEERAAIIQEMAEVAADEFWTMGISKSVPEFGIVKNGLENVPASMPLSWFYPTPAPSLPATYYWAN